MSSIMRALRAIKKRVSSGSSYRLDTYEALNPVRFSKEKSTDRRLNLFIPNIEKSRMYGGQKTAFNFFLSLLNECEADARILVASSYDANELATVREQYPEWAVIPTGEHSDAPRQIVMLDPRTRTHEKLPIRALDYFVYTYWTGAYALEPYRRFQMETFGHATPHIYLIQDFEPSFKAWSAEYLLTDSTYHQPDTIAVFNSLELKAWFDMLGYRFDSSYVFTPKLDPDIAKHLHDVPRNHPRENLLVFYGRPSIPRNCFPLIINALNAVLTQHPQVSTQWRILSIGSDIPRIRLSDGQILQSAGKMTLDDYAELMHHAKVGVSLMCSPHPSYPPLEMAAFGITTITNSFGPKNLGNIPHIVSLDSVSIQALADAIWNAMTTTEPMDDSASYPPSYTHYLEYTDFFDGIIAPIAREIDEDARLHSSTNY